MKKIIPLAFGLLWLSGCTQPVSPVNETSLVTPSVCCTKLNELPVQEFKGKSSLTLNFDSQTPRIAEGNARAQVVALPLMNSPYALELTTPLDDSQFLAVEAVLYDANWKVRQRLKYSDFEYREPALLQSHRLFTYTTVQPGIDAPRWLVISTLPHPQPDRIRLVPDSEIYAEKTQVEAPLEQARYARASENGALTLHISRTSFLANELLRAVTGKME